MLLRWSFCARVIVNQSRWIPCRGLATTRDRYRILFFGTDDFAAQHLKALLVEKGRTNSNIESIDLVCPPDRWTGRKKQIYTPSATKAIAELYGVPVYHTPEKAKDLNEWKMPEKEYDLGVVVSFGYFIPAPVIHSFKHGAINVHPSLLPKYRGAAPIQHTILSGDDETGVTVQELSDKEFDAGRILAQTRVDLRNEEAPRYRELRDRLAGIGCKLLIETIRNLPYLKANAKPQKEEEVTKAPKIKKEWSEIDFAEMDAWQIEQLHRAIGDQYPLRTVFTFTRIKRSKKIKQRFITMQLLNIFLPRNSPVYDIDPPLEPNEFVYNPKDMTLHVCCRDGNPIAFTHIKAEGSDAITARDFRNGYEVRNERGRFGYVSEDEVRVGMSGVRLTKRREEYAKTIRKRMGLRKKEYIELYGKMNERQEGERW